MNISMTILPTYLNFWYLIHNLYMEETLSQNVDMCPAFCRTNVEHWSSKKYETFPVFCHKTKTRTYINMLRHRSLHTDVIYIYGVKFVSVV